MNGNYFPIRSRMAAVGILQVVLAALTLLGVDQDIITGWGAWVVSVIDLLVMLGILAGGVVAAENNTTPLYDSGDPINPNYARIAAGSADATDGSY